MGLRVSCALQTVAACLTVAAWFLWPFSDRSVGALAYAILAGSSLLLISRSLARLLSPAPETAPMRWTLALFSAALLVGLACSLGLWLAAGAPMFAAAHELWARTQDALACTIAGLVLCLPLVRTRA